MQSYYRTLETHAGASPEELRRAFRHLLRKWHPDVNPGSYEEAHEHTRRLIEAYEVLKDPGSRAEYDTFLQQQQAAGEASRRAARPCSSSPGGSTSSRGSGAPHSGRSASSASSGAASSRGSVPPSDFASQSQAGRRAAAHAATAAGWGMDDILETFWKGSGEYRRLDAGFGSMVSVGFWGWLMVAAIALTFTGVGAVSWFVVGRGIYQILFPNGRFVGVRTLLGGMLFWLAIPVGFLLLLALCDGGPP